MADNAMVMSTNDSMPTEKCGGFDMRITGNCVAVAGYDKGNPNVKIPPEYKNMPVTCIEKEAFCDKEIASVDIPDSIKEIGYRAFADNKLTKITIPNDVKICDQAFAGNNITTITFGDNVTMEGQNAFDGNFSTFYVNRSKGTYTRDGYRWIGARAGDGH